MEGRRWYVRGLDGRFQLLFGICVDAVCVVELLFGSGELFLVVVDLVVECVDIVVDVVCDCLVPAL